MGQRCLVFGATGTAGRGAVRALVEAGHAVTCVVRADPADPQPGAHYVVAALSDAAAVILALKGRGWYDSVISCLASRSGAATDAWAVDYHAHMNVLAIAQSVGAAQFILLSAICVQKPELAFQKAKLAFEEALMASGLSYSIVRPTAFFKSLSGQIKRLQQGKPFLVFGDGRLTACKPISDDDLGRYMARCLSDPDCQNQILPIGGPGPAITPLDQGEALFALLGQPPKFKHVPLRLMDVIVGGLRLGGRLNRSLALKADLAEIGRYYARESMLVWDPCQGRYDAAMTPETGSETLFEYYADVIRTGRTVDLGDHSVF